MSNNSYTNSTQPSLKGSFFSTKNLKSTPKSEPDVKKSSDDISDKLSDIQSPKSIPEPMDDLDYSDLVKKDPEMLPSSGDNMIESNKGFGNFFPTSPTSNGPFTSHQSDLCSLDKAINGIKTNPCMSSPQSPSSIHSYHSGCLNSKVSSPRPTVYEGKEERKISSSIKSKLVLKKSDEFNFDENYLKFLKFPEHPVKNSKKWPKYVGSFTAQCPFSTSKNGRDYSKNSFSFAPSELVWMVRSNQGRPEDYLTNKSVKLHVFWAKEKLGSLEVNDHEMLALLMVKGLIELEGYYLRTVNSKISMRVDIYFTNIMREDHFSLRKMYIEEKNIESPKKDKEIKDKLDKLTYECLIRLFGLLIQFTL